jgi:hypothetical protein
MRYIPLLLLMSMSAFSLTTQDVAGTWKAEGVDGVGSVMELWYGTDGSRETRSLANYNDLEFRLDVLGTFTVSGENIVEKTSGGWTSYDGSVDPVQPDPSSSSSKAQAVAGTPKILKITDCDSPSLCTTHDFTFVSADKHFSLPSLDGGATSIGRRSRFPGFRIGGSGRTGARVFMEGRTFDLRGRMLGLDIRR